MTQHPFVKTRKNLLTHFVYMYATKNCAKRKEWLYHLAKFWTNLDINFALFSLSTHWYTPHFIQLFPLMYVFRLLRRRGKVMQNCSCFGLKLFRYLISKQSTNKFHYALFISTYKQLIDISYDLVTRFICPAIVHGEKKQRR